jgi:hypothetical protein
MSQLTSILAIAYGQAGVSEDEGSARRMQLVVGALLMSLALATVWGVSAGSSVARLAAANAYKLPLIVLISSLSALPAGLLAFKLSGTVGRASALVLAFASGVLAGTLVLAVLSPLVALYYNSSSWAGTWLGLGSIFASLATGTFIYLRAIVRQTRAGGRAGMLVSGLVLLTVKLATIVQLVALFSPILPERTVFDRGVDRVLAPSSQQGGD